MISNCRNSPPRAAASGARVVWQESPSEARACHAYCEAVAKQTTTSVSDRRLRAINPKRPAGEHSKKWRLPPVKKEISEANTLWGFQGVGVATREDWGSVCSKTSGHTTTSTHRSGGVRVGALDGKGMQKNTTQRVEIFIACSFYPCSHVFANKASDWRTPLYLPYTIFLT